MSFAAAVVIVGLYLAQDPAIGAINSNIQSIQSNFSKSLATAQTASAGVRPERGTTLAIL